MWNEREFEQLSGLCHLTMKSTLKIIAFTVQIRAPFTESPVLISQFVEGDVQVIFQLFANRFITLFSQKQWTPWGLCSSQVSPANKPVNMIRNMGAWCDADPLPYFTPWGWMPVQTTILIYENQYCALSVADFDRLRKACLIYTYIRSRYHNQLHLIYITKYKHFHFNITITCSKSKDVSCTKLVRNWYESLF